LVAILSGRPLIRLLKHWHIGKQIRIDGPSSHQIKTGTPTMGGVMFVAPVLIIVSAMYAYTRIAARVGFDFGGVVLIGKSLVMPMAVMLLYAILGAIDDYMGVRGVRRGEGMRGRTKFVIQIFIAVVTAVVMNEYLKISRMGVPGIPEPIDLGYWWIPVAVFVIVATTNAVNFADGLDGLAALISVVMYVAYGVIAYMQGQVFLTMFCMVTVGGLLGFLWFNVHPAALFMGDTGSEALGGALGVVALMTGQWLLLPIIAIIPVAEVVSVILQTSFFKLSKGKRLFKMAPIHHHFELLGWSESQVVQRFWLIAILSGLVGVGLAVFGNP
ncbi:MAG TPA: phospho-N-acetylmuramoyl-pentapeptide-transferase, partial [Anaerolineae bacterium]